MSRNIAPEIFRQRLLMEGFWTIDLNADTVHDYLLSLAAHLDLRVYAEPIIFSPASGMGKDENSGYDAFVPLIDSGISGYFWTKARLFSVVLYTCKGFDEAKAIAFTRDYFKVAEPLVTKSF